jgi:DNA-binding beta-propeller fold protein YncE
MALRLQHYVELPPHAGAGGFDHAAVHARRRRLFVAHTANDAVDVIETQGDEYVYSVPQLGGVAGALVSEEDDVVFSSNRGENTVSIFRPDDRSVDLKIPVGTRPNGMAYDAVTKRLLVAHVGDPAVRGSATAAVVDIGEREVISELAMPGKTRWAVFDARTSCFYVNIAEPPRIVVIAADETERIKRSIEIPCAGPHGLDVDSDSGRLFCACDGGELVTVSISTGRVIAQTRISGVPDVIFFHPGLRRLYVAVGDPGVVDVIETDCLERVDVVTTERRAKTMALDAGRNALYVFCPESHRAAVFSDS